MAPWEPGGSEGDFLGVRERLGGVASWEPGGSEGDFLGVRERSGTADVKTFRFSSISSSSVLLRPNEDDLSFGMGRSCEVDCLSCGTGLLPLPMSTELECFGE